MKILARLNHPELTTDTDDWDEFLGFCAAWLSDPNDIPKEILPGDNAWPDSVPPNVKHFAHAIKTEKQRIFPTTRFGKNEKAFNQYDGSKTEHGDIGESKKRSNNNAYKWIKQEAINAGVDF